VQLENRNIKANAAHKTLLIRFNKHTSTWYVNMSVSQNIFTDSWMQRI